MKLTFKSLLLQSIHQSAIQSLAELTSKSVEHFHKTGELLLLKKDNNKDFLGKAKNLERYMYIFNLHWIPTSSL